jgi:hypothetical protein
MQTSIRRQIVHFTSLVALSASLAACGGGGGGDASSANATEAQPPTPVSTAPGDVSPPVAATPAPTPDPTPTSPTPSPTPAPTPAPTPTPANQAPTLSGTPITSITAGQAYNFVPAAADADHDTLQFAISSKPGWATFDTATGRLWGSPTNANVASYEEIVISVTDGKVVTRLPEFSIVVNPAAVIATRSIQVSWQAPLTNTDGTALTDLKGYRILYGTQPGVYTSSVPVNNVGLVTYTIDNLETGKKYYFTMVAVNAAGAESDYSKEVVVNLT